MAEKFPVDAPEAASPGRGAPRLSFAEMQRWFLKRVVSLQDAPGIPGHLAPDLRADQVIKPSATLDPDARIAIYHRMYRVRVRKLLGKEHPVIAELLGDEAFEKVAFDYFTRFPPSDFTLRNLAHAFPYYLRHVYSRDDGLSSTVRPPSSLPPTLLPPTLLYDIAQLEHALSDAFDTPEMGKITAASLGEIPPEQWPELRFRMDPSFRLLACEYNASAFVDARKKKLPYPEPAPTRHWVVVWRHDNQVWRQSINHTVHEMLSALSSGETVTTALERGMNVWTGSEEALESNVFQWFADWMNEGYFRAIVLPSDSR